MVTQLGAQLGDPPAAADRPTALGYHPALDGLRGCALLAIIVYHSGVGAPGAFLSVSTFFTLSGFLITALLLAEHERDGRISLRGFWERRLRRLMPAALAAIALITVTAVWLADATQWIRLRADALASLLYVANWRFIAAGDSYGAAFESPSPFQHFWTLAIEEQFYVLLPLVVVGVLAATRGDRRRLAATFAVVALASLAWSNRLVSSGASVDRLYFGTDVRIVELLAGGFLALWWMRRPDPLGPRGERAVRVAGPVALAVVLVLWTTADLSDRFFYRGGLALYSLLTLAIIAAAMQPGSVTQRILSWKPLVWVGVLSYAAYLVHYPILIWLQQHWSAPAALRLGVAVVATFALAVASARFLERPVRTGRWVPRPAVFPMAVGGVAVVALSVVALTSVVTPVDVVDLEAARNWQRFVEQSEAQERSAAPRVTSYGDSTALMTGGGLDRISRRQPELLVARGGFAELGCGLLDGNRRLRGEVQAPPEECQGWLQRWAETADATPADVAVVQLGPWEVLDQQLTPGGPFTSNLEDPAVAAAQEASLRRAVDVLLARNGMVVLLSPPDVEFGRVEGRSPDAPAPESDPARMARFRDVVDEVARTTDRVEVVDLAGYVAAQEAAGNDLRPDGVHFTDGTALDVAPWLAPRIVEAHRARTGTATTQLPRS